VNPPNFKVQLPVQPEDDGVPQFVTTDELAHNERVAATSRDGMSEYQLEMLQQLNFAQVTEHPHLDPGDLVIPAARLDDPGGENLVEILQLTAAVLEIRAIAERTLGIVNDDHKKIHALELRVDYIDDQIQNILQLLAKKEDKKELKFTDVALPTPESLGIDMEREKKLIGEELRRRKAEANVDEGAAGWNENPVEGQDHDRAAGEGAVPVDGPTGEPDGQRIDRSDEDSIPEILPGPGD
jgi:hypothetical protein